jgi:hypothetical protein
MNITAAGNVGIGTTSPLGKLQIGGTSGNLLTIGTLTNDWVGDVAIGVNNGNGVIISKINAANDTNRVLVFYRDDTNGATIWGYTPSGGSTDIGFQLRANSTSYFNGGNVGIGTSSPADILDLYQSSGTTAIRMASSGAGSKTYRLTSQLIGISNSGFGILNATDSRYELVIDGSGNVGIGTTAPGAKLHVNYTSGVAGLVVSGTSGDTWFPYSNGINYIRGELIVGDTASTNVQLVTGGGNVGIGTASPGQKLQVNGALKLTSNPSVTADSSAAYFWNQGGVGPTIGGLKFQVQTNGSTAAMTIDENQRVGIGTTNPTQLLTVNGAAGYLFTAQENSSNNVRFQVYVDANEVSLVSGYNTTAKPITFYLSSAERMRIGTNGAMKFNTYGSGTFTGTATQKLAVDSSGNVIEIPIGAGPVDGSGTANYITRWVDTDTITTSSIYESSGNIGIGTTTPSYKLSINGSAGIEASEEYLYFNSSYTVGSNARAKIRAVGAGGGSGYGGDLRISTRQQNNNWNEDAVTIDSTGNVGIGTTSPTKLLTVGSSTATSGIGNNGIFVNIDGGAAITTKSGTSGVEVQLNAETTQGTIGTYSNHPVAFRTNNAEAMRIDNSQNVGIGTTTPAYKLSVVGKMALNDGGDSVFIGTNAGLSDDATANLNVAIGTSALQNNVTGASNVAIGNLALNTNLGSTNTAVGAFALQLNTTGVSNTAVGAASQLNSGIGTFNTSVGTNTLFLLTTGSSNAALGSSALRNIVSSSFNTAVGASALQNQVSGSGNTAIGTAALLSNVAGSANQAIGSNAGRYFGTGTSANIDPSASIFIGRNSRANASGEINQIVIGNEALGLGSDSVVLGNDNITKTALKGNVGIGTTSPTSPLQINGNGGNGLPLLRLVGSSSDVFNWASSAMYANLTSGETSIALIGKAESPYNSAYYGYRHDFDGSSNNMLTLGLYGYDYLVNILGSGNVGIGTTSPSEKLAVNGNIETVSPQGKIGFDVGDAYGDYPHYGLGKSNGSNPVNLAGYYGVTFGTQGTERMRIADGGNIGMGTSSPAYQLDVNGTARVTTLIETSAAKYKTNIQPLDSQLSKVTQLEPVTFDWIDKPNPKTNIGLIADEVEKIYPEFVSKTEDGEIEGIEYSKLTTVLIQSIKELKEIVDKQQEQINTLLNK